MSDIDFSEALIEIELYRCLQCGSDLRFKRHGEGFCVEEREELLVDEVCDGPFDWD